jgi:hypothetical protein
MRIAARQAVVEEPPEHRLHRVAGVVVLVGIVVARTVPALRDVQLVERDDVAADEVHHALQHDARHRHARIVGVTALDDVEQRAEIFLASGHACRHEPPPGYPCSGA